MVLANLAAALAGIITGVASARALGAQGRGDLAVVLFWPALVSTIVDFGVADAVTLKIARDPSCARPATRNGVYLAFFSAILGSILGYAVMPLLLRLDQASLLSQGREALAYVPLSALASVPIGALLGLRRFRAVAVIRVAAAALHAGSTIAVVVAGAATLDVLMWIAVAARGAPAILAMVPTIAAVRGATSDAAVTSKVTDQAKDGLALHSARLANVVGAAEDRVLAAWWLSQAEIGYWQVSTALFAVMQFISQAVAQQLFATAAGHRQAGGQATYDAYVRATCLTAAAAAMSAVALPHIIPALYGVEFAAAVPGSLAILVASIAAAGAATLQAGARAMNHSATCIAAEVVGIAVMALASLALVPVGRGVGLAAALAAGRMTVIVVMGMTRTDVSVRVAELLPTSSRFRQAMSEQVRVLQGKARGLS